MEKKITNTNKAQASLKAQRKFSFLEMWQKLVPKQADKPRTGTLCVNSMQAALVSKLLQTFWPLKPGELITTSSSLLDFLLGKY